MNAISVPIAVILGLMCGSFLNVVIFRLPRGYSVIKPRSFCPECGRKIRWYENIPLLSYISLRGRCGGCRTRIPVRYPLIEILGALLALFSTFRYGFGIDAAFVYSFLMALLAVAVIDWKHRIIPDRISLSFILVGLIWSFLNSDLDPIESASGAIVGGGSLYIVGALYKLIRHEDGMGGGDIKLMAMIGAFLGLRLVLPVIVTASLFGSVYGLALMRSGNSGKTKVAFGSFLASSAAICLFFGSAFLSWYLGRF